MKPRRSTVRTAVRPAPPPARAGGFGDLAGPLAAILAVAALAFSPALGNDLVRWDDYAYIVDNTILRSLSPSNLLHMFHPRTFVLDNYHPLTILSYAIEYRFVGAAPMLYHLDNLILHLLNVSLAAYVCWLLTGRPVPTLVAAALFALHPMRVESVAWAAERKDVLYAFFFLLSLATYVRYARDRRHPWGLYVVSLACLLLASLAKAQAVVLPLAMGLVDYWFARRDLRRIVLEKLPFLGIALALGLWATVAQQTSLTPERLVERSLVDRLAIANANLLAYLYKLVVPYPLACFYGYPADLTWVRWAFVPVVALAGLVVAFGRRSRVTVFGALFFVGTIAVVLQVLPIGDAVIADRFTYIPYLGLFFCVGHVVERLAAQPGRRTLVWTLTAAVLATCAALTYAQTLTWRNTEAIWRQVLRVDPGEPRAHHNLGALLAERGENEAAIRHLEFAEAQGAGYNKVDGALRSLGVAYAAAGRLTDAIAAYDRAVAARPDVAASWHDRGIVRVQTGAFEQALQDYNRAIELEPGNANAHYARGNVLRRLGRPREALADYDAVLRLDPGYAPAHSNRANSYLDLGDLEHAIEDYSAAIRLNPNEGLNYMNRSKAHYRLRQWDRADADFAEATRRGQRDETYRSMLEAARSAR